MAMKRCTECGAELELRPDPCPLCGAVRKVAKAAEAPAPDEPADIDSYQSDLRSLREQLRRLRAV